MISTTVILAGNYNMTPFDVMAQDTDEVIMLINYLLGLGQRQDEHKQQPKKQKDCFWDF